MVNTFLCWSRVNNILNPILKKVRWLLQGEKIANALISILGYGKVFINEASGILVQEGMSGSLNVSIVLVNETTYESDVSDLRVCGLTFY